MPAATASDHLQPSLMELLIGVLAVWRLTYLLWAEDGPWKLVFRLRESASRRGSALFECFYCLSLWVSLPISLLVMHRLIDALLGWLALSGGAILLERWQAPGTPVWRQDLSSAEPAPSPDLGG